MSANRLCDAANAHTASRHLTEALTAVRRLVKTGLVEFEPLPPTLEDWIARLDRLQALFTSKEGK